jgi:hypothetical protein
MNQNQLDQITRRIDAVQMLLIAAVALIMSLSAFVGWRLADIATPQSAQSDKTNAVSMKEFYEAYAKKPSPPPPNFYVQCPLPKRTDLPVVTSGTP